MRAILAWYAILLIECKKGCCRLPVKKILCLTAMIIGILVIHLPFFGYAQKNTNSNTTLSLHDAIMLTLRDNPDLQSTELNRVTQKYALIVAKNQFQLKYTLSGAATQTWSKTNEQWGTHSLTYSASPTISLKNSYGTQFTLASANPSTYHGTYNPTLTLTVVQPLIKGFGREVVQKALNDALDSETSNILTMKDTIVQQVKTVITDYLTVIKNQESVNIDNLALKNYQTTAKNTQALIDAGQSPAQDIIQAQTSIASQKTTLQSDINTLNTSKNTLFNDLGLPNDANIVLPTKIDYDSAITQLTGNQSLPSQQNAQTLALASNLSYHTQTIALKSLQRALLVARDNRRWQLDLTTTLARGGGSSTDSRDQGIESILNGRNHNETMGLALSIPINDVSSQSDLLNAKIALDQAIIALEEQKIKAESNVINSRNNLISSQKQLQYARQTLALQQKTVNISNIKYAAGLISSFQLLTEQNSLVTDQQTLSNSIIAYITSLVDFNYQTGVSLERWGLALRI